MRAANDLTHNEADPQPQVQAATVILMQQLATLLTSLKGGARGRGPRCSTAADLASSDMADNCALDQRLPDPSLAGRAGVRSRTPASTTARPTARPRAGSYGCCARGRPLTTFGMMGQRPGRRAACRRSSPGRHSSRSACRSAWDVGVQLARHGRGWTRSTLLVAFVVRVVSLHHRRREPRRPLRTRGAHSAGRRRVRKGRTECARGGVLSPGLSLAVTPRTAAQLGAGRAGGRRLHTRGTAPARVPRLPAGWWIYDPRRAPGKSRGRS